MLASAMAVVAYVAAAGALASWVVGAVFYARTLAARSDERRGSAWFLIPLWPFVRGGLGESASHGVLNKALVALMAFVLVAAAAYAVSANLQRLSR